MISFVNHHANPFDGTYDAEVLRGLAELLNRIEFRLPEMQAFQGDAVEELRIIADRLERR